MTRLSDKENYLRTLEFRGPERIPVLFHVFSTLVWKHGDRLLDLMRDHPRVFRPGQIAGCEASKEPEIHEERRFTDAWGCEWLDIHAGMVGQVVGHPLADGWDKLDELTVPDPTGQWDWDGLRRHAVQARAEGDLVEGFMDVMAAGFFDRLQFLRGLDNLLIDFLERPPELDRLMELLLDYNLRLIDLWLDVGIDVLQFHGDIGMQNSLMMRPETFRDVLKPAYKQMFQACRQAGIHVSYSSDGNLLEIVDDLVECGVSVHDPQVRACTIDGIARAYRGKLCARVDLDQQMLPFCTPEEIHRQVQEVVEKVAVPEGGLILYACPTEDVPFENIQALCEALDGCVVPSV